MTAASTTEPTPAQIRLVVRLNRGVNLLGGRDDLIVWVKWDADPNDPPAWFTPARNEITLNGPVALDGAAPSRINPLTPEGRRRHPVVIGLLCHEASHGHSTRWDANFGAGVPVVVARAAVLLEDIRIERRQLQRRPGDRLYLRAASQRLILPRTSTSSAAATRWQAATAALLTAGRVDAGVLSGAEVRRVLALCRKTLGRTDFNELRTVWREALDLADGDVDGLMSLASRWVDLLSVDDPADAPAPACAHGVLERTPSDDGDAPPDAGGETRTAIEPEADDSSELADALAEAFAGSMTRVAADGVAQAAKELAEELAEDTGPSEQPTQPDRAGEQAEQQAAADQANQVFHGHGYSPGSRRDPRAGTRPATADERALARRIGAALRRARYRDRGRIVTLSALPPGRLLGREAMLGEAQRARGAPVTAMPFRQVIRRDTPEPPLTVGIAVDISGSMRWATDTMASVAWMVAHAVDHVGGQSATVAFGERVTAITKPGRIPAAVQEFEANDGFERFADAIRALDGELRLVGGEGARLVFVVSDGHFGAAGEKERAVELVGRLVRSGVAVLWIDLQNPESGRSTIVPEGAVALPITSVQDIPGQVTTALVRALRAH